jgi:hypothetical protein
MEAIKFTTLNEYVDTHNKVEKAINYWNSKHSNPDYIKLNTEMFIDNGNPIFVIKAEYEFKRH